MISIITATTGHSKIEGKRSRTGGSESISVATTPFLRWVGGKQQLVSKLLTQLPPDHKQRRYVEPFVGAGSLFFALCPEMAFISDANSRLIETYLALKTDSCNVRNELAKLIGSHSLEHYYLVRDRYNACNCTSASQAARFIYLNKTCFNGIFRVNKKGKFNVPKGSKDSMPIPTQDYFDEIAQSLSNAEIVSMDFFTALRNTTKADFVYLDPPYPALTATAYFAHYTVDRFPEASQKKLAKEVKRIDKMGAKFLLSNADVPSIRKLYREYTIDSVPVKRYVNSTGVRTPVSELIIRNY